MATHWNQLKQQSSYVDIGKMKHNLNQSTTFLTTSSETFNSLRVTSIW